MYQIQLVNHDSAMYHHSTSIPEEDNASISRRIPELYNVSILLSTPLGSNESAHHIKTFILNVSSAFR